MMCESDGRKGRTAEAKAASKGVKLILPTDVVLADKFAAGMFVF